MEDDEELQRIYDGYKKGEILTGELKATCIKYLQDYVKEFQDLRAKVTEEVVDEFMAVRPLNECQGNPKAPVTLPIRPKAAVETVGDQAAGDGKLTKNQLKKIEKEKQIAAKKAAKAAEKEAAKAEKTEA